ncbi:unnamed protein product [Fusarium langsethiae]|nr:unnamed protein product [Fusarium langsethiae]
MSREILLNISDPQVMGAHMKTLIDLWVEHGLTDTQFLALEQTQNVTKDLDTRFVQALAHEQSCPENLIPYFWETSTWYRTEFHQYQDRQFSRLYNLERSVRTSLASGGALYIVAAEDVYPPAWISAMKAWGNSEEQLFEWSEALQSRQALREDALVERWIDGRI